MKEKKYNIIVDNIPFGGMLLVGALTIATSFVSFSGIIGALCYLLYGIAGAFWIMFFVCPYCRGYGNDSCPSGYGKIAAKMVSQKNSQDFDVKFKKHIPVIVPLWLIPVVCGGIGLWQSYSWLLLLLVVIFIFDSWIILPMLSRQSSCAKCPQKTQCPWIKQ